MSNREGTFHHQLDQRLLQMLELLQEQPGPAAAPRVRVSPPTTPSPAPPSLPSEGG